MERRSRPILTSKMELWAIAYMVVASVLWAPALLAVQGAFGDMVLGAAALGFPFIYVTGFWLFLAGRRRRKRALLAHELRVCVQCRQSLQGLPDEGRCPECGQPYTVEQVQEQWEREYPSLKLRPDRQRDDDSGATA